MLLRTKSRALCFNHLFNKPYGEIKLILMTQDILDL
nr:MAG TPA: hypothetical protein [Caudoviricetes sp.]